MAGRNHNNFKFDDTDMEVLTLTSSFSLEERELHAWYSEQEDATFVESTHSTGITKLLKNPSFKCLRMCKHKDGHIILVYGRLEGNKITIRS